MRNFKWILCISLFLGSVFLVNMTGVKAQGNDIPDIGSVIDGIMEEEIKENHIPNAAVTVVHQGNVIFSKGYGFTNLKTKEPVDPNHSLFRIGSISKLFTWTAVMQLVEQKKLDLDTDINKYIDFEIPADANSSGPITLRHLMTHTPGFEDYADSIFRLEKDEMPPLEQYVRKYLPERVFPAGEVAAYSNYGTTLAGYIVEQVSGLDYSDYVEKNIFSPLQMENSTFHQPLPKTLSKDIAQSYRYVDGEFLAGDFEYMPAPAGGMSSSATDMAKFMNAILENDGVILRFDTLDEMMTQQFTEHPDLDGMTLGFIEKTRNDKRLLMHGGSTMIYDSSIFLLPEEELGIFVTYSGGNYTTHTKVINGVMDEYFPLAEQESSSPPEGMKERAKAFVGEYHQNRRSLTTTEKFLSLMNGPIRVGVDDEGYLLVTHMGVTNLFIEIEESIYQNLKEVAQLDPYGEFSTIVFGNGPNGGTTLMTDGPMSYSKAPWYATSGFTFLSLIISLLIIIGTMISWLIAWVIRRIKGREKEQPKLAVLAKRVASLYGVFTILFLIGFALNAEMSPIYGLPTSAFMNEPTWMVIFKVIPYLLVLISFILLVLMVLGWSKKRWKMLAGTHYTIFTLATIVLSWLFYYWNII